MRLIRPHLARFNSILHIFNNLSGPIPLFLMKPTQAKLEYFDIMRGPWDRQDHQKPFAVDFEKPVGAGFYPEDLDEEKLKKYIDEKPEDAAALNSLVTMVDREAGGKLVATNYSQVSFFQDDDEMSRHKSSQNTVDI